MLAGDVKVNRSQLSAKHITNDIHLCGGNTGVQYRKLIQTTVPNFSNSLPSYFCMCWVGTWIVLKFVAYSLVVVTVGG